MSGKKVDIKSLDLIFNKMIQTMDQSKNDIFIISEQSRQSFDNMKKELDEVRSDISRVITEGDYLEDKTRYARRRLAEVSKNFNSFTETQVRQAYETANDLQIKLSINRTEEKQLRERRDDLERRLSALQDTIQRADQLVNQVNVVLNYLTMDLKDVGQALESAKVRQDYSMKIIEAQEEERKRVSREIHDGPAQMMANVLVRSDLIERTYNEKGPDSAFVEIGSLKEMVRNALSEVRRIIYDLRPMALDDLGLAPTLKKYLATFESYNSGTTIHFQSIGEERRFLSNYEISIFRLIQEAVTNAVKHGKAQDIWVKIEWLTDVMNIVVKDNGVGFEPKIVKDQSFGLIGMQERVDLLKGEMAISSAPSKGALLLFRIPIKLNLEEES